MKKEDIVRKLTSRKFWMAIVGLVTGILVAFNFDAESIEKISGIIMAGASVIAYIIGEGLTDAAREQATINIAELPEEFKIQ